MIEPTLHECDAPEPVEPSHGGEQHGMREARVNGRGIS